MSVAEPSLHDLAREAGGRWWLRAASALLSISLLGLAAWLLHRYLLAIAWHDVVAALAQLPR